MRPPVIALSGLMIVACCPAAFAGDVRHPNVPEALRGSWAATADVCSQQQKIMTLSDKSYTDGQSACDVTWVEERAARPGTIYSAHMLCRPSAQTTGDRKPTNLVMWVKDSSQVTMGPALNALTPRVRCP